MRVQGAGGGGALAAAACNPHDPLLLHARARLEVPPVAHARYALEGDSCSCNLLPHPPHKACRFWFTTMLGSTPCARFSRLRSSGHRVSPFFYNLNGTQERGPVPDAPAVCVPTACTSYKHPNGQCLTLVVSYIIAPTAASVDAMRSDMRRNMCSRVIHVLVLKFSSLCLQVRCLPRQLPVKVTPPIPSPLTACSLAYARRLSARICNFF